MFRCLVCCLPSALMHTENSTSSGGSFQELTPQQEQLVAEIVRRFNPSSGQSLNPEQTYDNVRISVRSTFEAVTQALATTKLTSKSGKPFGERP